jgi:CubicO group peptidase (beta-lactamase class C family)
MRRLVAWTPATLVALAAATWTARAEEPSFAGTWEMRLTYKDRKPESETARLVLADAAGAWTGSLSFERNFNGNKQALADVVAEGASIRFTVGQSGLRMEGRLDKGAIAGRWIGEDSSGAAFEVPWTATRLVETPVERFDKNLVFDPTLPQGRAEDLGMDGAALDALIREASRTDTDALVVVREGKVVAERYFGKADAAKALPAPTRFVAAFAAALLVEEKKLASFDVPLGTWFPDWREGRKGKVMLRHLLSNTSGIEHFDDGKLRAARDEVAFARGLPVGDTPGTVWRADNDSAVELLAGALGKVAGRPIDDYLRERLFAPLGVRKVEWKRDPSGNPLAWDGLSLPARDLARVGVLVAADGELAGTKVISKESLDVLGAAATTASPTQGLLWDLHLAYPGTPPTGVEGRGAFGQWIVVFPKSQTVGVRLRARKSLKDAAADAKPEVVLTEFPRLLANTTR